MKEPKKIMTQVMWREIADQVGDIPDDELEVLVYDGYSDQVVIGFVESDGDGHDWIDVSSQLPIKDPQWWADIPFPVDAPSFSF